MYKVYNQNAPRNLLELFEVKVNNTYYNLRSKSAFNLKFVRTTQKQMCLSIRGIKLWNSLTQKMTKCKSIQSFKTQYKKDILSKY